MLKIKKIKNKWALVETAIAAFPKHQVWFNYTNCHVKIVRVFDSQTKVQIDYAGSTIPIEHPFYVLGYINDFTLTDFNKFHELTNYQITRLLFEKKDNFLVNIFKQLFDIPINLINPMSKQILTKEALHIAIDEHIYKCIHHNRYIGGTNNGIVGERNEYVCNTKYTIIEDSEGLPIISFSNTSIINYDIEKFKNFINNIISSIKNMNIMLDYTVEASEYNGSINLRIKRK